MSAVATRERTSRKTHVADDWRRDAEELRSTIREAHKSRGADTAAFRKDIAERLDIFLTARRDEARARLENGGRGEACAQYLSHVEDLMIRSLHETLIEISTPERGNPVRTRSSRSAATAGAP